MENQGPEDGGTDLLDGESTMLIRFKGLATGSNGSRSQGLLKTWLEHLWLWA